MTMPIDLQSTMQNHALSSVEFHSEQVVHEAQAIARNAFWLTERYAFTTKAEARLADAEKALLGALADVRRARIINATLPVVMEAAE